MFKRAGLRKGLWDLQARRTKENIITCFYLRRVRCCQPYLSPHLCSTPSPDPCTRLALGFPIFDLYFFMHLKLGIVEAPGQDF